MSLRELQQKFANHILHSIPYDGDSRIFIYEGGYYARFVEALAETYESCKTIVGEEEFEKLVYRYIHQFPSKSYNIFDAGAGFPFFITTDEIIDRFAYLYDIAKLEWGIASCFHSIWKESLDPNILIETIQQEEAGVCLQFQEGLTIISSPWNIDEIRKGELVIQKTTHIKIFRHQDSMRVQKMDFEESELLNSLLIGRTLSDSIEGMDPTFVKTVFSTWIASGLVVGVSSQSTSLTT